MTSLGRFVVAIARALVEVLEEPSPAPPIATPPEIDDEDEGDRFCDVCGKEPAITSRPVWLVDGGEAIFTVCEKCDALSSQLLASHHADRVELERR